MAARGPTRASLISGTVVTPTGERVIPASKRADGSVRPERRVRSGFIAAEDVARYAPPQRRAATPPTAAHFEAAEGDRRGEQETEKSKAAKKNERRREAAAKRRAATGATDEGSLTGEADVDPAKPEPTMPASASLPAETTPRTKDVVDALADSVTSKLSISSPAESSGSRALPANVPQDDPRIKKLKASIKKLKQTDTLVEKRDRGEKLEPEQKEKISRRSALVEEIASLEKELIDEFSK
jgi:partner of Y14 and mago protein